jgi:L-fuconolactonase
MRIDAHQHFWIYNPREYGWIDDSMRALRRNFLPADLIPEMQAVGFEGSVAVQARQRMEETSWLLQLAEHSPSIVGVVGWTDLCDRTIGTHLKKLSQNPKLVGIRHIVQSEPDDRFLMRPEFLRGVAALEEFGLTYDILIYAKHLPVAVEFVARFPKQPFVVDHLAKPDIKNGEIRDWAEHIRALAQFPNVFCKLSGMITEADWHSWTEDQITPYLHVAFEAFGPSRLMIGSDWPVCLVAGSYSRATQVVTSYVKRHAPGAESEVLGRTAARFYRLKMP